MIAYRYNRSNMSEIGWVVPLTPQSLPNELVTAIGHLALSFAGAENAVVHCLAGGKSDGEIKRLHENSFRKNLDALCKKHPSLSEQIREMRADALSRNTIMHGFLFSTVFSTQATIEDAQHTAINRAYDGHSQNLTLDELERLSRKAMAFAVIAVSN